MIISTIIASQGSNNLNLNSDGVQNKRSTTGGLHILVIEDDPSISSVLSIGLAQEGFDVIVATDGKMGLMAAEFQQPALIILDLKLPDMTGDDICKRLRQESNVPILVLTARNELKSKLNLLELGADDYMTKPFSFAELTARMKTILRRAGALNEKQVLHFLDIEMRIDTHETLRGQGDKLISIHLSNKEFNLLQFFMSNPRIVFTKTMILDRVWGEDSAREENVVEAYIGHLRRKMGEPFPIQTIQRVGYCLKAAEN